MELTFDGMSYSFNLSAAELAASGAVPIGTFNETGTFNVTAMMYLADGTSMTQYIGEVRFRKE